LTADQVRNPPRDHQALLPQQTLAVTCSFQGPTHLDVNLIAPLRSPHFNPLINLDKQVSPNCAVMILAVRRQQNGFCYLQDDRNVVGSRPKVALSKTNLMTSVITQLAALHAATPDCAVSNESDSFLAMDLQYCIKISRFIYKPVSHTKCTGYLTL
jgi:hypothetical protein